MNKEEDGECVPFIAVSGETTEGNRTGNWRTQKPFFPEKIAPCKDACPIGQDIPAVLNLVKQGKLKEAWLKLLEANPLPLSTAMVCQGFCEKVCNRGEFDEPVSVNAIERFLGKEALKQGWSPPVSEFCSRQEKKIAVIGSGPAGLSCAYQLARKGYEVTVLEALSEVGGLLRVAIPNDRLPKDLLEKEIFNNILGSFDISVRINCPIDAQKFRDLRTEFDAIFVAVGCHLPKKLGIPGENSIGVFSGLGFLQEINLGRAVKIGNRVVVIGDGNTAIDCAHCLQLLGKEVLVLCQKARKDIPDFLQKGIEAVEKKGAEFSFSIKPLKMLASPETTPRQDIVIEYSEEKTESKGAIFGTIVDNVIVALGEEPDLAFLGKRVYTEENGIFFGGSPDNVSSAIASGREGAERIIAYLDERETSDSLKENREPVKFQDLNTASFEHLPRQKKVAGPDAAAKEAERCFSCGTCISCGICEQLCPDISITFDKDGQPQIDEKHCKGCGICAYECPRKVIDMKMEEREE